MNRHKTTAAAGINRHAGSVEVEKVRDAVCHDGDAISGSSVLRLPVGVSEAHLFIVWANLERVQAEQPVSLTFDKRSDVHGSIATVDVFLTDSSCSFIVSIYGTILMDSETYHFPVLRRRPRGGFSVEDR